ncbi:MAG: 4-hydroxythreonine-4-phosphate dehydrogenase PdxA [Hyphomicrobiaceae bacterium]|nr:4-hydroxythreonine-4-phosphate dehydrogenase PdxA [Hyphomicrobiaceae bacterium]
MAASPLPLAVSMGEPAGIGPDLLLSLYALRQETRLKPFIVFGHRQFLEARAERLGLEIEFVECFAREAADAFPEKLPVFDLGGECADLPGEPTSATADIVTTAIARGVDAVMQGLCSALVTAPINKAVLQLAGFPYPGHTEYLAALAAPGGTPPRVLMMLADRKHRVVPLTIHIPLRDVPDLIRTDLVVECVQLLAAELQQRFGIQTPKIGVSGLNPHAGEDGLMGSEDAREIAPAISILRSLGFDVTGPLPADTLFVPKNWERFDCVVAMYHDQALIPIKTIAFDRAVNITLGLPFVRTSPDHGTAFELAGTGKGSAASMLQAIRLASELGGRGA